MTEITDGTQGVQRRPQRSTPDKALPRYRNVVFLCVHNSARSQIAEAMARTMAPEGTNIWSAGTNPTRVHPETVLALKDLGLDPTPLRSKHIDEIPWRDADLIVSVCGEADDVCPAVDPVVRRVHWPLPDPTVAPEAERAAAFRLTCDQLRWRISSLWPSGN